MTEFFAFTSSEYIRFKHMELLKNGLFGFGFKKNSNTNLFWCLTLKREFLQSADGLFSSIVFPIYICLKDFPYRVLPNVKKTRCFSINSECEQARGHNPWKV